MIFIHFGEKTFTLIEFQCVNYTGHECGDEWACTPCGSLGPPFILVAVDLLPHLSLCSSSDVPADHRTAQQLGQTRLTRPKIYSQRLFVFVSRRSSTFRPIRVWERSFNSLDLFLTGSLGQYFHIWERQFQRLTLFRVKMNFEKCVVWNLDIKSTLILMTFDKAVFKS